MTNAAMRRTHPICEQHRADCRRTGRQPPRRRSPIRLDRALARLNGLVGGGLVVGRFFHAGFELIGASAEVTHQFWQLGGTKQQQNDESEDDHFHAAGHAECNCECVHGCHFIAAVRNVKAVAGKILQLCTRSRRSGHHKPIAVVGSAATLGSPDATDRTIGSVDLAPTKTNSHSIELRIV